MKEIEQFIYDILLKFYDEQKIYIGTMTNEPESVFIKNTNVIKGIYTYDRNHSVDIYYYTVYVLTNHYEIGAQKIEDIESAFYQIKSIRDKNILDIEPRSFGQTVNFEGQYVFMLDLEIKKEKIYGK